MVCCLLSGLIWKWILNKLILSWEVSCVLPEGENGLFHSTVGLPPNLLHSYWCHTLHIMQAGHVQTVVLHPSPSVHPTMRQTRHHCGKLLCRTRQCKSPASLIAPTEPDCHPLCGFECLVDLVVFDTAAGCNQPSPTSGRPQLSGCLPTLTQTSVFGQKVTVPPCSALTTLCPGQQHC